MGRAVLALSLAVAAVVVVGVIAYVYLMPDEGNTPEEVFLAIIEAAEDGDVEDMTRCSVACFADDSLRGLASGELECQLWTFLAYTVSVNSYELVTSDESAYVQGSLNAIVDYNEATYSVDIVDCCAIVADCTITIDDRVFTDEEAFPFVKIVSDWYLALVPIPEGEVTVEHLGQAVA